MITLLVVTDGRWHCIKRTIPSALTNLYGPITRRVIYDDSGDIEYRDLLRTNFPTFNLISHIDGRQGFGGAISAAWRRLLRDYPNDYVFHLEDDFLFNEPIDLGAMIKTLEENPHLAQLVLKRQAWNEEEKAAGGIIEQHPEDYRQQENWVEHKNFWSTNPSLYRYETMKVGWPEGNHSEGMFTHELLRDPALRFAFWGKKEDPPVVTHIGEARAGVGY